MKLRTVLMVVAGVGSLALTVLAARAPMGQTARLAPHKEPPKGVSAEGQVVTYPGYDVVVGAERGGRLVRVLFVEGQKVAAGDLLAEIESDELQASLAEARAGVAESEAEVSLADATLKRRRDLAEEKVVSAHDLDQATRDLETAVAKRDTARATVTRYEAQIRKSRILAPISGTIVARSVDAGQTVETGTRVATLADLGRVRIEAEADESDASGVSLGAGVVITAEGYPGRSWKGTVEEIPDSVTLRRLKPQDPSRPTDTRILAVKVAFAERTPLKLGTTVELRIEEKESGPTQKALPGGLQ
jgi:RND family efflux transporter MFP subunit